VSRPQAARLRDILDAIEAIRAADALLTALGPDVRVTAVVADATTYQLVVIGEAVKALEPEVTALRPETPWSAIAGLRDVVTHHYHRRDPRILRATVETSLEPLRQACEALLEQAADGRR